MPGHVRDLNAGDSALSHHASLLSEGRPIENNNCYQSQRGHKDAAQDDDEGIVEGILHSVTVHRSEEFAVG